MAFSIPPFLQFMFRRVLQIIPVVIAIAALNFLLLSLAPGDAADVISANNGGASAEEVQALRESLGLDRPMIVQFFSYMGGVLTLDLGQSYVRGMPVLDLVMSRVPATLLLMVTSLALAVLAGILLGILSSTRYGSLLDRVMSIISLLLYSTPHFWLALMMIVFFSVHLGLLPSGNIATIGGDFSFLGRVWDVFVHLILPAVTMAMFYIAVYMRLMRSSMLEVLDLDYITAARARGASEKKIAYSHAARNALLPVVTLAGVQIGHALGGSVLIETVFGWPGLGRLVYESLLERDTNTLMGILVVSSVLVIVVSLCIDLVCGLLDPRIVHK
ncbi:ABC transporter permease [Pseudooceanicola nanhaiensis]|uniref:ABC transporter permease n=1 Tax=Pseudooceanicola nanhaiensis TaxID=375761 RepID=UPI001CD4A9DC|nr:ABC transporter permease [Pseudooceanicola nanhaiensis]MCA0918784.1 ABC transporter permease [Pseudooceanicola nanhaiensis]